MDKSPLSFFLPQLDGSIFATLQIIFALVFVAAIILIPVLTRLNARPGNWQRRLAAIEGADHQAAIHDTPEQLSQAVATAPERWADVLPSLLLVFGLLGTFIGLGLALNDAAGVLGGADALGSLTPILDALGSKFKISTWGIIAFLFLKIWAMLFPVDAARLAWSTRTIQQRAALAAEQQIQKEAAAGLQQIAPIVQSIDALLAVQRAEAQRAHVRHAELLEALQRLAQPPVGTGRAVSRPEDASA
ncbi:hypothetical protein [Herbaspirillum sp. alder98]|uniref:hypothetical protein n=1 Tax=Herbaspirillum sp. alder98 TaxID=2913096 RepID=UPI001CD8457A|nr:hypothetical protein [Herbaspirillum sp. alder98]MCA1324212.1 hypothetical protein [Herbaspirillum sp. alder98]